MKNKNITLACYLASFILLVFLREHWLFTRAGLHIDESQSFILAEYNSKNILSSFLQITGDQFRNRMWFNDPTFVGMIDDVVRLWHYNRDTPHSNLYYTLLRVWFTGVNNSDFHNTLRWAIQLNILLFSASFVLISMMIYRLFRSHIVTITGGFIAFIGASTISNTIFARPYQLQETMFIAFLYMTLLFVMSQKRSVLFMVFYGVITAFTLLTGYFAIPFVLMILFFALLFSFINKEVKPLEIAYKCSVFSVIALGLGYLIYPKYMFVVGYRQSEALSKTSDFIANAMQALRVNEFLNLNYFFPIIVSMLTLIIAVNEMRKGINVKENYFFSIVIIVSIIWSAAIIYFAPYKTVRYMYPVIPLFAIPYCYIAAHIIRYSSKAACVFCGLIISASTAVYIARGEVEYQFAEVNLTCEYSQSGNALFVIKHPWHMQIITYCLSNESHYMTNSDSTISGIIKDKKNIVTIISDYDLEGYQKIGRYAYFNIYKANSK